MLEILNDKLLESSTPANVCIVLSDAMDGLRRDIIITATVMPVTAGNVI